VIRATRGEYGRTICLTVLSLAGLLGLTGCDLFVSPEKRVARAEAALSRGEARAAVVELRAAVNKDPANATAHLVLARALLQLGEPGDAEVALNRAREHGASTESTARLDADIQLALSRFEALLQRLDEGQLPLQDDLRALYRGRALLGLSQLAQAKTAFDLATSASDASTRTAAQIGLAAVHARLGDFDTALKQIDEVLAQSPGEVEARHLRGTIHMSRGQFATAEAEIERALEAGGNSLPAMKRAELLATLVEARLGAGKKDDAASAHEELAAFAPGAPITRLLGARLALAKGDYTGGIAELQRLVSAMPDFVPARMLLGAAQASQGNLEQAEAELAAVVQRAPDNIEARKLLARVRLQLDRPDAALTVLSPALEAEENDADLFSLLGAIRFRLGGNEEGIAALERSVAARPDDVVRKLDLAGGYIAARRYDEAIRLLRSLPSGEKGGGLRREALLIGALSASAGPAAARTELERALRERPDDLELLYLAAAHYRSQREFDRAREYLNRAREVNPSDVRGLAALAGLELAMGNLKAAEDALRQALATGKAGVDIHRALSLIALRRNDRAGAIAVLEDAQAAYPDSTPIRLDLARAYFAAGDAARARNTIDKLLTSKPGGSADLFNGVGLVLLEAGHFDEALGRFRDAVDAEPANVGYLLNLARAQLALDRPASAAESLNRALALQPDWVPAVSALVLMQLRAGQVDKAFATVQGARKRNPNVVEFMLLEGDVHMAARQFANAAAAYAEAQRLKPSAAGAVKLHQARDRAGQPKADGPLLAWLGAHPEDVAVRLALSEYYIRSSRLSESARELQTLSQQEPGNVGVLNNLAWVYHELKDARATDLARRAHELAPNNPAVADTYGWILFQTGESGRALPLLEVAARRAARDPEIQYHYAAVLAAMGRKDEARETLRKIFELQREFPARTEAERLMKELQG